MKKIKRQTKKSKTRKVSDTSREHRRLEVLIEDVRDDIKLVAEQYGGVQKDIGGIKKDVGGIKKDIDEIKTTLNSHTETLNSHTEKLNSHTQMIGKLMMNVEIIKEDVAFIKGSLKEKVDLEEFTALERRVAILERRL